MKKTKGTDTWDYTYDFANRLKKVEKNDTIIGEYEYDGDDRRIQATENNETTTYIYTGWSVLYEENSTGTACHIYGPFGLLAKRTTVNQESNTYFYHTDHLGSTRLVTDDNKNIVTAVTYHPFREIGVKEGSEDFLFTGKEIDSTGLYYYGARYYDPEIGRFLTRDTWRGKIHRPQSLNRYTYCYNNPIKFIDLWGNFATAAAGTGVLLGGLSATGVGLLLAGAILVGVVGYYAYDKYIRKNWKGFGEIEDVEVHEGKVELWDKDRNDPDRNKLTIHIDKETGKAREIILIIDLVKVWTYWKEGDTWYKHKAGSDEIIEVTDQNELDWIEKVTGEAEDKWNEEFSDTSGKDGKGGEGTGSSGGGGYNEGSNMGGNPNGLPQPI